MIVRWRALIVAFGSVLIIGFLRQDEIVSTVRGAIDGVDNFSFDPNMLPFILSVIGSVGIITYILVFSRRDNKRLDLLERIVHQLSLTPRFSRSLSTTQLNPIEKKKVEEEKEMMTAVRGDAKYNPFLPKDVRIVILRRRLEEYGVESVWRKLQHLKRLKEGSKLEADKEALQAYSADLEWLQFEYNVGGEAF